MRPVHLDLKTTSVYGGIGPPQICWFTTTPSNCSLEGQLMRLQFDVLHAASPHLLREARCLGGSPYSARLQVGEVLAGDPASLLGHSQVYDGLGTLHRVLRASSRAREITYKTETGT